MLTDTSSLDPHMIQNGSHMFINGVSWNWLGIAMAFDDEVATSVLISAWLCHMIMEMESLEWFYIIMMILTFS